MKMSNNASIFLLSLLIFFIPSLMNAEKNKKLAVFYKLQGTNIEEKYNQLVEKKLPTIGFNLTDPHHRVNDQYETKYGSTQLDILSFLPVINDSKIMPLFNIDPRLAGFSPFNMLIYKTLKDDSYHIGHLTPEAIIDIIGIDDKKVKNEFIASFKPLDFLLDKELGDKKSFITYGKLSGDNMLNFEYTFDRPEDIDDFIDLFQNKFEMSFINEEYLIAGFHDFLATDKGEEILKDFDVFWSYSLCHLGYSYNMFDNDGARPDAGLFAPCTMYMYVKKGTNKLVVGMPKLLNIMETLNEDGSSRVALVNKLDTQIPKILTKFGMVAVSNVNPLKEIAEPLTEKKSNEKNKNMGKLIKITIPAVPSVPKVTTKVPQPVRVIVNGSLNSANNSADRSIKFSKRMPPNYLTSEQRYGKDGKGATLSQVTKIVGDEDKGRISAYLRDTLLSVDEAKERLLDAGFEILAVAPLNKKKKLISIVFTSEALKKMATKENRGYLGTLRLLVDPKNKQISITNPLYLAKAFTQNNFTKDASMKLLRTLSKAFPTATNSLDKLKFQLLPKYQFMNGMPFYQDMMVVARGKNLKDKLTKNKRVVFFMDLANGTTLVGVKLSRRTGKFPKRIGTNNAGMLPYPLIIENGEAKILDPKYYLALMYPQLTMEQFMTIATIPDAIRKDCVKVFR